LCLSGTASGTARRGPLPRGWAPCRRGVGVEVQRHPQCRIHRAPVRLRRYVGDSALLRARSMVLGHLVVDHSIPSSWLSGRSAVEASTRTGGPKCLPATEVAVQ
jgi:hypothetical protein